MKTKLIKLIGNLFRTRDSYITMVEKAVLAAYGFKGSMDTIEGVITAHFSGMSLNRGAWQRETFKRLLLHLYTCRCYTLLKGPDYIQVLANVSAFGLKMVREIETWEKTGDTPEEQLESLIAHCFAHYEVPAFMVQVFGGESRIQMLWYIQLGRGCSVRQLSAFPVAFTGMMEYKFRETPVGYTLAQAIRKAQALGYGATGDMAETLAWTAWGSEFANESFRAEVVRFLARVREIVRFDVLADVLAYLDAAYEENPRYSMKGRTWRALVRQTAEWQRERARKLDAEDYREWDIATIRDYRAENGSVVYTIEQLKNSDALYNEGWEMSHCVAEYAWECEIGESAIFSLRKYSEENLYDILATIQVLLECKTIVQAKAAHNGTICDEAAMLIAQWAEAEQLIVDYEYFEQQGDAAEAIVPPVQRNDAAVRYAVWIMIFLLNVFIRQCNKPEYRIIKTTQGVELVK